MVLSTPAGAAGRNTRPQSLNRLSDHPLNFEKDQVPNLRRLDLRLAVRRGMELLRDPPAALLLGGTLGLLVKRRFALASLCAAGLILERAMTRPGRARRRDGGIAFERAVLKAQRGDYGSLEVIPFR